MLTGNSISIFVVKLYDEAKCVTTSHYIHFHEIRLRVNLVGYWISV